MRRWKVPRLCGGCGWGRFMRELFLLCVLQRVVVPVCVNLCGSWSCGCRSHWNGCMNVAWVMFWGGSRSTKPCVFPCKVAAAGEERYLVCAAGAAGVVSCANCSSYMCFATSGCSCVRSSMLESLVAWSHWNGCMNVAWDMFWGGSRSTKPCVFPCKVAACRRWKVPRLCGGCGWGRFMRELFLLCVLQRVVVPVCVVLCGSWISGCMIALEWLHECCMGYVLGRKPEHETLCFSV